MKNKILFYLKQGSDRVCYDYITKNNCKTQFNSLLYPSTITGPVARANRDSIITFGTNGTYEFLYTQPSDILTKLTDFTFVTWINASSGSVFSASPNDGILGWNININGGTSVCLYDRETGGGINTKLSPFSSGWHYLEITFHQDDDDNYTVTAFLDGINHDSTRLRPEVARRDRVIIGDWSYTGRWGGANLLHGSLYDFAILDGIYHETDYSPPRTSILSYNHSIEDCGDKFYGAVEPSDNET